MYPCGGTSKLPLFFLYLPDVQGHMTSERKVKMGHLVWMGEKTEHFFKRKQNNSITNLDGRPQKNADLGQKVLYIGPLNVYDC